jgi:colanic acid/amylovoran biosynthesis protein
MRLGVIVLLAAAAMWRTPLRRAAQAILPENLRDELAELAAADLVVSAGGTYLVPHYRMAPKLLELLVPILLGRPCVLFTQSLGPFSGKWLYPLRFVLRRARLILVRDSRSFGHLIANGIDRARIGICADAAFALPPVRAHCRMPRNERSVAISVRDWPHFRGNPAKGMDRYVDAIAALVRELVERHDVRVVFVSTCQGVPEYWTDDSRTADAVVARLSGTVCQRVSVDRAFRRPDVLMEYFAKFELVVATRMHAAILALNAGTPVLPVAYEFKTHELFGQLEMEDLVNDIEDLSADKLCTDAGSLLARSNAVREEVRDRVAVMRRSAFGAESFLQSLIEAPA